VSRIVVIFALPSLYFAGSFFKRPHPEHSNPLAMLPKSPQNKPISDSCRKLAGWSEIFSHPIPDVIDEHGKMAVNA
jgi:hypothetical protein